MKLNKTKILVAGGAGFIGSATVNALVERGNEVLVIDDLSNGKIENIKSEIKFFKANIASFDFKNFILEKKPQVVYNFVSNVEVPKSNSNPLIDMNSIVGSVNLFAASINGSVEKVIFSSSGFIYGNINKLSINETMEPNLISSYAIAKHTIENYLKFFYQVHKLKYIILRYATAYGPGQTKGAMSDYIKKLSMGEQAEIWGNGSKTRDYVYINDIVRANLLALETDFEIENPVFNIGTGREISLKEVYFKIAELLGKKADPIYLPDRKGELIRYCLDYSKAKKFLGWKPKYSLEEGLKLRLKLEKLIK